MLAYQKNCEWRYWNTGNAAGCQPIIRGAPTTRRVESTRYCSSQKQDVYKEIFADSDNVDKTQGEVVGLGMIGGVVGLAVGEGGE